MRPMQVQPTNSQQRVQDKEEDPGFAVFDFHFSLCTLLEGHEPGCFYVFAG